MQYFFIFLENDGYKASSGGYTWYLLHTKVKEGKEMHCEDDFSADRVLLVFGENIKKARLRKNLTKKELADNAAYDRGSLCKLEKGQMNIKLMTAVKLARTLNVSFPALFSRNFMKPNPGSQIDFSGAFQEDNYLLVFREKFNKQLKKYSMHQVSVTDITELNEQMVSRLVKGVIKNPTLKTLYALAYSVNGEMHNMFSRTQEEEKL